ncbi:hypothetical protein BDA96_02G108300 [Sorghum bicolor]|uniref:Uncharacterized protein n=1 Tax=Sorghum bicolor TaxID=4558 RepID=A0A921US32_SORBI|nr:hypothetical protein BDA96_02G108300 [Sorghum bicolor]
MLHAALSSRTAMAPFARHKRTRTRGASRWRRRRFLMHRRQALGRAHRRRLRETALFFTVDKCMQLHTF